MPQMSDLDRKADLTIGPNRALSVCWPSLPSPPESDIAQPPSATYFFQKQSHRCLVAFPDGEPEVHFAWKRLRVQYPGGWAMSDSGGEGGVREQKLDRPHAPIRSRGNPMGVDGDCRFTSPAHHCSCFSNNLFPIIQIVPTENSNHIRGIRYSTRTHWRPRS